MSLKTTILDDMKLAMREKDKQKVSALRLLTAAIKQVEVDERKELTDSDDIISIVTKMIKQRKDSVQQYQKAERQDLADQELFEIGILENYLPKQLSESELDEIISKTVSAVGAANMADMGKVMGQLKPQLAGKADMSIVSQKIKALLQ
jgi:hypothetical protein